MERFAKMVHDFSYICPCWQIPAQIQQSKHQSNAHIHCSSLPIVYFEQLFDHGSKTANSRGTLKKAVMISHRKSEPIWQEKHFL